jgi:hypothetical protein
MRRGLYTQINDLMLQQLFQKRGLKGHPFLNLNLRAIAEQMILMERILIKKSRKQREKKLALFVKKEF